MDLVKENYEEEESQMINLIRTCDYISFDLKMTGNENDQNNIIFGTLENIYNKYKISCEKFDIIQLGFTIFNRENKQIKNTSQIIYNCYPYNLYLYPNTKDLKNLSSEMKSILFKDFNKCINHGIHYLNQRQYRELYKNITQDNINNGGCFIDTISITGKSQDLTLAENTIKEIKENFLNEKIVPKNYIIDSMPKHILYYIKKKLPNNLFYKENFKAYDGLCTLISKFNTKEEKEEFYKNDILRLLKDLEQKKGAKKIIDALFNKIYYGDINIKKNFVEIQSKKKL